MTNNFNNLNINKINKISSFDEISSNDKDSEESFYRINEEPLFPEQNIEIIPISNSIQQGNDNKNRTSSPTSSSKKRIEPLFTCQNFGLTKRKGRKRKIIKNKGIIINTKKNTYCL